MPCKICPNLAQLLDPSGTGISLPDIYKCPTHCTLRSTTSAAPSARGEHIQVESGALTHFGCGDAACFPVHNILYTQMKAQCLRYVATDFHVDRFSSVFENQLQSWSTDFGFLPPSSPLSETAEASGVILQLRHSCVSHSAMIQ